MEEPEETVEAEAHPPYMEEEDGEPSC